METLLNNNTCTSKSKCISVSYYSFAKLKREIIIIIKGFAHYITCLSNEKISLILKLSFWNLCYICLYLYRVFISFLLYCLSTVYNIERSSLVEDI